MNIEILIFAVMAAAILYLMWDNRKLERKLKITIRVAVKEQAKRKTIEVMAFGRELDEKNIFEDPSLYEDL